MAPPEFDVVTPQGRTIVASGSSAAAILADVARREAINWPRVGGPTLELWCGARRCAGADVPAAGALLRCRVAGALVGGKGGFGAMLRSMGKVGSGNATKDFGACRDLSGRRLRHVNDEIALQRWHEARARNEARKHGDHVEEPEYERPAHGIDGWHLAVPAWAELPKIRKSKATQRLAAQKRDWRTEEADVLESGCNTREAVGKVTMVDSIYRGFAIVDGEIYVPMWSNILQATDDWNGENAPLRVGDELRLSVALRPQGRNKWSAYKSERTAKVSMGGVRAKREALVAKRLKSSVRIKKTEPAAKREKSRKMKGFEIPTPASMGRSVEEGLRAAKEAKRLKKAADRAAAATFAPVGEEGCTASEGTSYLGVLSGEAAVLANGVVRGVSAFGSVVVVGCRPVAAGKWYYEAELLSDGVIQVGWADQDFVGDEVTGDGVGDDAHSWAFDGCRRCAWTGGGSVEYGADRSWKKGDVVGCCLDADAKTTRFTLNGDDLGLAFESLGLAMDSLAVDEPAVADAEAPADDAPADDAPDASMRGFVAACSMEDNESVRLVIHREVMRFPPPAGYWALNDASLFDIPAPTIPAAHIPAADADAAPAATAEVLRAAAQAAA
ncbi:hypothetical protein M885DRAFT_617900 [Pelagophyceae sp. CCMP2097]|nr:hypothetical protein M885DRAFT_617900 [Pelagophyceae sp. CCMP2097]